MESTEIEDLTKEFSEAENGEKALITELEKKFVDKMYDLDSRIISVGFKFNGVVDIGYCGPVDFALEKRISELYTEKKFEFTPEEEPAEMC